MTEFTMTVRTICESLAGNVVSDFNNFQSVIRAAAPKVFNFSYPIFDESHRAELQEKILLWYYDREIGFKTAGRWKLALAQNLNLIMPYYNEMYKTNAISYDILEDVDLTEESEAQGKDESEEKRGSETTGSNNTTNNTTDTTQATTGGTTTSATSDTPQGTIADVDNQSYLTSYNKSTSSSNNNGTVTSTGSSLSENSSTTKDNSSKTSKKSETFVKTTKGKSGGKTYAEMIMEYRKAIANVDAMIIAELEDLFVGAWNIDSII